MLLFARPLRWSAEGQMTEFSSACQRRGRPSPGADASPSPAGGRGEEG